MNGGTDSVEQQVLLLLLVEESRETASVWHYIEIVGGVQEADHFSLRRLDMYTFIRQMID
jgi:succinylarginine dihydrolase